MFQRTLMTIAAMVALVACALPATAELPPEKPLRRDPRVPEIAARDLDGEELSLYALLAKGPVLLDFWALWCRPCLKELPELNRLHERYAEQGFTVVAVNTDSPVDVSRVKPFLRSRKYSIRVISDVDGELKRRFQINAFPTTLLVDTTGVVVWSSQGYRPGDENGLEKKLLGLLPPATGTGGEP